MKGITSGIQSNSTKPRRFNVQERKWGGEGEKNFPDTLFRLCRKGKRERRSEGRKGDRSHRNARGVERVDMEGALGCWRK